MRKMATTTRGILAGCLLFVAGALSASAQAGVALGATRVIYPAGQKQVQLAVTNNDDNSTWLIQSWVENADGVKDGRFIVCLKQATAMMGHMVGIRNGRVSEM